MRRIEDMHHPGLFSWLPSGPRVHTSSNNSPTSLPLLPRLFEAQVICCSQSESKASYHWHPVARNRSHGNINMDEFHHHHRGIERPFPLDISVSWNRRLEFTVTSRICEVMWCKWVGAPVSREPVSVAPTSANNHHRNLSIHSWCWVAQWKYMLVNQPMISYLSKYFHYSERTLL